MSRTKHARGSARIGRLMRRTPGKPKIRFGCFRGDGAYFGIYACLQPSYLARLASKAVLVEELEIAYFHDPEDWEANEADKMTFRAAPGKAVFVPSKSLPDFGLSCFDSDGFGGDVRWLRWTPRKPFWGDSQDDYDGDDNPEDWEHLRSPEDYAYWAAREKEEQIDWLWDEHNEWEYEERLQEQDAITLAYAFDAWDEGEDGDGNDEWAMYAHLLEACDTEQELGDSHASEVCQCRGCRQPGKAKRAA